MRTEQMWLDDEQTSGAPSLTRRGVLAGSLKLLGGGALALTLANAAGPARLALAQEEDDDDDGAEGEVEGEVEGGIQVGTTEDDAADDAQVEGEADAGAELPAEGDAAGEDEQTREERRAARQAEEAAVGGGTTVGAVPSTGVGALGSSLGGVMGAIGLAAATGAAALFTRRHGADSDESAG